MSMLNIGSSALLAAQNALATTSHNISNVNTAGYSRQRTDQGTQPANFEGGYYIGNGVGVTGVDRIFNQFLVNQLRTYTSAESQQDGFLTFSKQVDDLLGSSSLSISGGLEAFFNSVQEVANDPTSIAARQVMLTQGDLLANRFNTMDSQLGELDRQIDNTLSASIKDINVLSQGIKDLNLSISESLAAGYNPNDLLDKRDKLIGDLSELVSVNVVEQDNGAVNVFIGNGQGLVVGNSRVELSTIADNSTNPPRTAIGYGPSQINITQQLSGGEIGGAILARTDVVDSTRAELDILAESIVTAFNTAHGNGIDLNGNAGTDFFDAAGTTAATISMNITDTRLIAASSTTNPGVGNNENALAMAALQTDKTTVILNPGPPVISRSFNDQYGSIVSQVATRTNQATVSQETQAGLVSQIRERSESVSGVNLDEEAANLIKFQQAYQAASQIITVSNTVFNSLINAF